MNIRSSDIVLEIGPGAYPFWRSDCLADVFDETSNVDLTQFGGAKLNTKGKPLFQIINGKLPFKDKSFDYVICSHVFEHVQLTELPQLASEIMRVGKKAYIEFPRPMYDYLYNFAVHVNLLDIVNGKIICIDKKNTSLHKQKKFTDYCMRLRKKNLFSIDEFYPNLVAVGYEFTETIPLSIIENEDEFWNAIADNKYFVKTPSIMWKIYNKFHAKRIWKKIVGEKNKIFFDKLAV